MLMIVRGSKARAIALILLLGLLLSACGAAGKLDKDSVLMTVGSREVTTREFQYWLLPYKEYYEEQNNASFWKTKTGRETERALIEYVERYLKDRYTVLELAKQAGIALSEEETSQLRAEYDDVMQNLGSDPEAALSERFTSGAEYYRLEYEETALLSAYLDWLDRQEAFRFSEKAVAQYAAEREFVGARQILLRFTSAEEKAQQAALADDLLARLAQGEDFGRLMEAYSQADPALLTLSLQDESTAAYFRDALRELPEGGHSGAILLETEWQSWYVIVERRAPDPDAVHDRLREERVDAYLAEAQTQLEIREALDFGELKLSDFNWR